MRTFLKVIQILLLLMFAPLIILFCNLLLKIPIPDASSETKESGSAESASSEPETCVPPVPDCFRNLGFSCKPKSASEVKSYYRRMAMSAHPDVGGSETEMKAINRAYEQAMAYYA